MLNSLQKDKRTLAFSPLRLLSRLRFFKLTPLKVTYGFPVVAVRAAERLVRLRGAPQRLLEQHQPTVSSLFSVYLFYVCINFLLCDKLHRQTIENIRRTILHQCA